MIVEFRDGRGVTKFRTLNRRNVRKVAHSIQKAHPGHPLPHTIAALQMLLQGGGEQVRLGCTCEDRQ